MRFAPFVFECHNIILRRWCRILVRALARPSRTPTCWLSSCATWRTRRRSPRCCRSTTARGSSGAPSCRACPGASYSFLVTPYLNNNDLKYKNQGKTLNFLFCSFYMLTTLYANIFISLFIFGIIWSMVGIIFKMWICQQSISLYHCFVVIVVVNTLSVGSAATLL